MSTGNQSESTPRLARGSSVMNLLVLLAVVAGLGVGGRMLWRKVRLDGFHVKPSTIEAPGGGVVLYTASWCGKSKKAKALLQESGVAYEERDIDRIPGANDDIRALDSTGVPVLIVGNRKIVGWDRAAYAYLLEDAGLK